MKSLGKFPDRFVAEIAEQPQALRRAGRGLVEQSEQLARLRDAVASSRSILFTGMGSSYDACYPIVSALAGQGRPCSMLDTAELLHFRMTQLQADSLLVCVSQSGESAELVRLIDRLPAGGRPTIAAVTNGSANTLAAASDIALDTCAGEELGPSTMTFVGAMAVLEALTGDPPLERAALEMERLLAEPDAAADQLSAWIDGRPTLALVGRGSARAAAEMGALTLKEAARFPAESLQAAQFRHGPLELAGPELAAVVFASEVRTRALDAGLAADLVAAGAAVLVITPDGAAPAGAMGIATGELADGISSAVSIVPVQLLSWALARSRGLEPGTYTIASKVTTHE
jgi:glucosamine--fructose-6-phosphate aminotransferase (isomerizing)